jgi:hypothetical protein
MVITTNHLTLLIQLYDPTGRAVCGHWLAKSESSNPAKRKDIVSVVFCQVEISASICHSSKGVLVSVVCTVSVPAKPRKVSP